MFKRHILVCETGWQRIRELSISLSLRKIPSAVLIKGLPDRQVRRMITKYEGINNIFIPERFFIPYVFIYIFLNILTSKRLFLFVEGKKKTFARLTNLKKIFPGIELNKTP